MSSTKKNPYVPSSVNSFPREVKNMKCTIADGPLPPFVAQYNNKELVSPRPETDPLVAMNDVPTFVERSQLLSVMVTAVASVVLRSHSPLLCFWGHFRGGASELIERALTNRTRGPLIVAYGSHSVGGFRAMDALAGDNNGIVSVVELIVAARRLPQGLVPWAGGRPHLHAKRDGLRQVVPPAVRIALQDGKRQWMAGRPVAHVDKPIRVTVGGLRRGGVAIANELVELFGLERAREKLAEDWSATMNQALEALEFEPLEFIDHTEMSDPHLEPVLSILFATFNDKAFSSAEAAALAKNHREFDWYITSETDSGREFQMSSALGRAIKDPDPGSNFQVLAAPPNRRQKHEAFRLVLTIEPATPDVTNEVKS